MDIPTSSSAAITFGITREKPISLSQPFKAYPVQFIQQRIPPPLIFSLLNEFEVKEVHT